MSSYFKLASGTENVGLFYLIAFAIVLAGLLNFHKIVRILGKSNVLLFSTLVKIIATFFLIWFSPGIGGIIFLMIYIISGTLEWVAVDIILESFSEDKVSGRVRGLHLTILNTGYLVGPILSTRLLDKFSYQGIFIFLLIVNSLIFIIALVGLRGVNHKFRQKESVISLVKKVFHRKDIRRIGYISYVLEFFYALMVIYTPLYLRDLGISWESIGLIFTIMLVPFVILQFPAGVLADKKIGEKEMLIFSIILMAASTLAIYFIQSKAVLVWAIALFATRIGAALIEILRDSYFYKRIDGRDVDIINFFRTAIPVAYISASLISYFFLTIFPVKVIFVLVAVVVISALYPAFRLEDSKCEKEVIE
jgi:MFS family permease